MDKMLHSNFASTNKQLHISSEVKRKLLEKIVQRATKLSLMLDETASLNKKNSMV